MLARWDIPLSSFKRKETYSGHELASMIMPKLSGKFGKLSIQNGEILSGQMDKDAIISNGGLIHVVYNDFGSESTARFINQTQALLHKYFLIDGFSVGLQDMIVPEPVRENLKAALISAKAEVAAVLQSIHTGTFVNNTGRSNDEELEQRIRKIVTEKVGNIALNTSDSLDPNNRIMAMVNSGAKANKENVMQMVAMLGQQNIDGKRAQYSFEDRTLPHFPKYDNGLQSRGFVDHNFLEGLNPFEYFFHAMGGREGLIDTAVKTSETGYLQRKFMKIMEDLKVHQDRTVRNPSSRIVQYKYGDDNIDSTKVETVRIDLMRWSNEKITREYGLALEDLKAVLMPDSFKELQKPIVDLVNEIRMDRDILIRKVFALRTKKDQVQVAVNCERLLNKYKNPSNSRTDLLPEYVAEKLKQFLAKPFVKNELFGAVARFYLAPKKVIIEARLPKASFDMLMSEMEYIYIKALVNPAEAVGPVAAQSVGEPTTQLTLNTFHSAGTAKANATSGVPRIKELADMSSKPKKPSNVVYAKPDVVANQDAALSLKKKLQTTKLKDIIRSLRVYWDPKDSESVIEEDREFIKSYYDILGSIAPEGEPSQWLIRLEIDDEELIGRGLTMETIKTRLEQTSNVVDVKTSDTNAASLICRIRLKSLEGGAMEFHETRKAIYDLEDTILSGVPGITRVFLREESQEYYFNPIENIWEPKKPWVLDTEGVNLYDILTHPDVDATRTFSNDILEIQQVFGIEAARSALFNEFMEALGGSSVNYHHMALLVDTMTQNGFISSVGRHGMNKNDDIGPLAKASFETSDTVIVQAAVFGELDPVNGVSANIMLGQLPSCGTGDVAIFVDETLLPAAIEKPTEAPEIDGSLEQPPTTFKGIGDIFTDTGLDEILAE